MTGLEGLLAGRVLGGRYRIEEVIGRGGMGAVYRAVDERLGREVAVKVVTVAGALDADSRDRLRARFLREARAAAALPHHPNVVPVYDYGTDPTLGLDYIVMELLRGNDLANHLARSAPPPLPAALKILYEAARGVAVGHRAGMIHRDVKPGNLFLAEDHGEVQVRVLDFGIAKLVDDEDTLAHLTQDGRAPHSPAFASPEQLRGLGQLTPASDVFSLGAVGFQLLSGERPFSEADRNRMSLGMPVPVPSLRERNPAIPTSVADIVERALAFDPQDRFADAGAMAADLGQAMRSLPDVPLEPYVAAPLGAAPRAPAAVDDDRTQLMDEDDRTMLAPPVRAERPGPQREAAPVPPRPIPPRPREPERGRSWGSIIVWSLVLLVLAGAGVAFWMNSQSRPTTVAEQDPGALPPEPISVEPPEPSVPLDTLETQPELRARILYEDGRRFLREGDTLAALEAFAQATEMTAGEPDYHFAYGQLLLHANQPDLAAREFQRVIALDPQRASAHFNLARAHVAMGNLTAAWTSANTALDVARNRIEQSQALRLIGEIEEARTAAQRPVPMDTTGAGTIVVPAPRLDTVAVPRDTARGGA